MSLVKEMIGSSEAARIIGVSLPTLAAYRKKLSPTKNDLGQWRFEKEKIVAFARWYRAHRPRYHKRFLKEGEKAARAFKLFQQGCKVSDVVIDLEVTPEVAKEWLREFQIDVLDQQRDLRDTTTDRNERRRLDVVIKQTELAVKRTDLELKREQQRKLKLQNDKLARKSLEEDVRPREREESGPSLVEQFLEGIGKAK